LTTRRFWWQFVLLMWTPHGGGPHMSAISSLYLSSPPSSTWPLAAGVPLYLAVENLACCVVVPTATWCPRQRNRLPKLFDDQLWPVLRVEWSKIPNFGVRWLEPNSSDSSMVKNELFQKKIMWEDLERKTTTIRHCIRETWPYACAAAARFSGHLASPTPAPAVHSLPPYCVRRDPPRLPRRVLLYIVAEGTSTGKERCNMLVLSAGQMQCGWVNACM
jgi:hypothetical protein